MAITQITDRPPDVPRPDVLEEAILAEFDELDAPTQEGGHWKIADEGSADWALRKLSRIRAKAAMVNAQATRQVDAIHAAIAPYIEPITAWQTEQTERLAKEAGHWEALLVEYHRSLIEEDPKALSLKLAHGTLSSRKLPDKWEFDEESFIAWATANAPSFVRVKEEADKALAKKSLKVDDEGAVVMAGVEGLVPGVIVTIGDRKFEVSTEELAQ